MISSMGNWAFMIFVIIGIVFFLMAETRNGFALSTLSREIDAFLLYAIIISPQYILKFL